MSIPARIVRHEGRIVDRVKSKDETWREFGRSVVTR